MDIGIDLGTTFSVIAVNGKVDLASNYPPGTYLQDCDVTIIPSPLGDLTFPSVIIEDPDQPGVFQFGVDALMRIGEGLAPVMFSKRKMGTRETITLSGRDVVAKDVATIFLRYLKGCAERALGTRVTRAVVTHPAYFDRAAVEETREAAIAAGFDMSLTEQMLMEPVAAALAYTRTDQRDPLRVLTYDLGGGTFDVTCMERHSGVIAMLAFDGDHLLGGYNFDRALVHWLRKNLETKGRHTQLNEDDPLDRARLAGLLQLAEQVKIELAKADDGASKIDFRARGILVDTNGRDIQINERISRDEFIQIIAPLLQETVACCQRVLHKSQIEVADLDEILLVGGSTYGPWITTTLIEAFPNITPKLFIPDLCVGAGAAIHAKMVLPALICDRTCHLALEVPESVVQETFNVRGRITSTTGQGWDAPTVLTLKIPNGSTIGPIPIGHDGWFIVEDVELNHNQLNDFLLRLENQQQECLLEHQFQVLHAPDTTETSCISTVLPKPLFIETLDGFVPLAKEGVTLPAQCEQTFQRENDNPNISLKLFQGRNPIGEIRIKEIPSACGRGALVYLKVQVTDKNEICGLATVRSPDNRTVHQVEVQVSFDIPDVQSVEQLANEFNALKTRVFALMIGGGEVEAETFKAAQLLTTQIAGLFEQQPVERQEITVALRRLHDLLVAPKDDMVPTRDEFCMEVAACRQRIAALQETARLLNGGGSAGIDSANVEETLRLAQKAKQLAPKLDEYEQDGLAAHKCHDRKAWGRAHESIGNMVEQLRDKSVTVNMPTAEIKMVMFVSIIQAQAQLEQRATEFKQQGRFADWQHEIERIRVILAEALGEVLKVDDSLVPEQALAHIRLIYARTLQPVKDSIVKLGIDIRKV